ncbi:hypothetical protein TWF102_006714 [Orbilia oligospora]|uniref:Uncharacterized protein n=1 Tax=Orbilia oligospora TaxID=2813651 RepID=A0A7C8J5U7_ORBOL|nr:hypothetical protein TWF706_001028 [Orbilia oligospora]KAF3096445.1 hypothetical protein TWF102_006714 [Orbilia oligospora]KAF3101436.1 hypothetical protein TWF103_008002 [Orbilia oligospora]
MVSQFQQTDSEKTVQESDQEFENAIQREEVSSTCDRFKFPEWLPAAIDDVLLAEDMGRWQPTKSGVGLEVWATHSTIVLPLANIWVQGRNSQNSRCKCVQTSWWMDSKRLLEAGGAAESGYYLWRVPT